MKMNLKKKSRLYFINSSYFIENPFLTKIEKPRATGLLPYVTKKRDRLQAIKNSFLLQSLKTKTRQNYFFNRSFDKNKLKALISWSILSFGEKKTIDLVEKLKTVGYSYATKAGISLGIDDLKIPSAKKNYLQEAQQILDFKSQEIKKGHLTSIEFFSQVIEIWNKTSEILKEEVIENFKKTDELNPVFLMAFSGARGNISQVRQLVGLRGLMSDVQGQIINYPILSNFREGLTLTEYVISCYGARKGVVDTALRTATSGYLTRRLVDVAQHIIVRRYNCGTKKGVYLSDLKKGQKTILSLKNRILGRRLAEDIIDTQNELIGVKNQEITKPLAVLISKIKTTVLVRSPLTCLADFSICQLCYGWSLSSLRLVPLGEAVGTIAAQSIGEPGTQLTMRTFHTGGVFSGEVSQEIKAPFRGIISFSKSISGKLTRTAYGQLAFLTKQEGFLLITPEPDAKGAFSLEKENVLEVEKNNPRGGSLSFARAKARGGGSKIKKKYQISQFCIPAYSLLFVKQNELVEKDQVLAEESSFLINPNQSVETYQTIYSEFSGEVRFQKSKRFQRIKNQMVVLAGLTKTTPRKQIVKTTFAEKQLERSERRRKTIFNRRGNSEMGEFWILSAQKQAFLKPINLLVQKGDFLHKNAIISLTKQNNDSTSLFVNTANFGTSQQNELQKNFPKIVSYDFGNNFFSENKSHSSFSNKVLRQLPACSKGPSLFSHPFFINLALFNEKFFFRKGFLFQKSNTLTRQNVQSLSERLKKGFRNNLQISGSLFHSRPYFILLSTPNLELLNVLKTEESVVDKLSKPFFPNTEQNSIRFCPSKSEGSKNSLISSLLNSEVKKNSHQIGFLPLFKTKTGGFGIQETSLNVFQSPVKASTLFLLSQTKSYDKDKFLKIQENFTKEILQDFKFKNLKFSYFHLLGSVVNQKKVFSKKKRLLFPTVAFSSPPFKIKNLPRRKVFVKKYLLEFSDLVNTKLNRNSIQILNKESQFFFADKQKLPNYVLQKSVNKTNIITRTSAASYSVSFSNFVATQQSKGEKAKATAKVGFNKSFFEHLCGYSFSCSKATTTATRAFALENFKVKSLFDKDILKLSYEGFLLSPLWLWLFRYNYNCQSSKTKAFFSPFTVTKARGKLFHFIFSLEKVKTEFRFIGPKEIVTRRLVSLNSQTKGLGGKTKAPILKKSCGLQFLLALLANQQGQQKSSWSLQKNKSYVEKTSERVDRLKDKLQPCVNTLQERQTNPLFTRSFPLFTRSLDEIIKQQATTEVDITTSWEYLVPKRNKLIWFQKNQKFLKYLQLADLSFNFSVKKRDNKKQKSFHFPHTNKFVNLRGNFYYSVYDKLHDKTFQLENKPEFEGWSCCAAVAKQAPFYFLNYQNQRRTDSVTTTCKVITTALSQGVKKPYDLKVSPFSFSKPKALKEKQGEKAKLFREKATSSAKRNKKKLPQKFQNDFNPGLKKVSLSRVFLLNRNNKKSFFSSKSLFKFWDTPQLYALEPNMFLNDKDKKLALFTFHFTKKVKCLSSLGSLLLHGPGWLWKSNDNYKKKNTFLSITKESRKKRNPQGVKKKSSLFPFAGKAVFSFSSEKEKAQRKNFSLEKVAKKQIRVIKKSEILFSIFHYQIFQKCCNASLSVPFGQLPEPIINKANLGVFQYRPNLLNKIPVFDSLINSARCFNLSLKAKKIFFKNLYKDLETSYKIRGLTLNPIFPTFYKPKALKEKQGEKAIEPPTNTRNRYLQPSLKRFQLEEKKSTLFKKKQIGFQMTNFTRLGLTSGCQIQRKNRSKVTFFNLQKYQFLNKKKILRSHFYNSFSDQKFHSDYGFVIIQSKTQVKKFQKSPFVALAPTKARGLPSPLEQSNYQRSAATAAPAFSPPNFRLSFIIPGKKNVYQSSNLASFSNQIRSRVFKNFQQTFFINNTNVFKENSFRFLGPTCFFVPKSSLFLTFSNEKFFLLEKTALLAKAKKQKKLDFKRKKNLGLLFLKKKQKVTAGKVFLNSFKNQYFITKWSASLQMAVENRNNLTPIWGSYLLNYSQTDLKWIQQILQKKTFHFFVISNLLPLQKTRKTKHSFQFLLTDFFNQNTFTPFPSCLVLNKQVKDGNLGRLHLNRRFSYEAKVVQVENKKHFHPKKIFTRKTPDSVAYLLTNYPGWIFSIVNPTLFLHKHNCINSPGNWIVNDISFDNFITLTRFVPIRFQNRFFQLQGKIDLWQNILKTFSFNKLTKTYSGYKKNIFEKNFNIIKKELFYLKFANGSKGPKSKKSFILHPSFISKYQVEENLKFSNCYQKVEDLYLKFLAHFDKKRNILKLNKTFSNFYSSAFLLEKSTQNSHEKNQSSHEKNQSRGISPVPVDLLQTQGKIRKEKTNKRKSSGKRSSQKILETKSLLKMTKFFSSLSQPKIFEAKKDFLFKKVFILKSYLLFPFNRLNLLAEEISWSEQKILLRASAFAFSNEKAKGKTETKKLWQSNSKINGFFHTLNPIFVQNKQTINNYCRLNNFKTLQLPLFSERLNRSSTIFTILSSWSLEDLQCFSYSHYTKTDFSYIPPISQNRELSKDKTFRFEKTPGKKVRLPFLNNGAFTFNLNARFKPQLSISEGFVLKESSHSLAAVTALPLPFLKRKGSVLDFQRENKNSLASVVVTSFKLFLKEKQGLQLEKKDSCGYFKNSCILDKTKVNKNQRKVDQNKKFIDSFEKMAGVLEFTKRKNFYLVSNLNQTLVLTQKSNQYFSKTSKNYKNQISNLLTKTNQVKKRSCKPLVFSLTSSKKKSLSHIDSPTIKSLMLKKFFLRKQLVLSKNSYNKKAATQLTHCDLTYLSLIQNKQKVSQLIDFKTNSMLEIYWTFFESSISKQNQNSFPQYKETELPESTFHFNSSNGKSPLRLVKLRKKTTFSALQEKATSSKKAQEKKRISKVSSLGLNSDFKNTKTIVKVTQDNKKVSLKKNKGLFCEENFAEVRELKINTVDDQISSPCEKPKKISYFFRTSNVISKDFLGSGNIWKTFSFSYFLNKRNKKKKEEKSFRNKKSAFQSPIKILKPLFNPFQKQDDLFFSLKISNFGSPNWKALNSFTATAAKAKRKGTSKKMPEALKSLNPSKNSFLLNSSRERGFGLFQKFNRRPLSSKVLRLQPRSFRFLSKIGLTKRYSFVLTKPFPLNFINKAAVSSIPSQQGKGNKVKGQNKVLSKKQFLTFSKAKAKAKASEKTKTLLPNKDKNFTLRPNFESFTKRFLTLTGNLIPFKKVSVHFPIVETKFPKRDKNSKAKQLLQKLQNKVFKNIYTIDFNSYFFLKSYSNDFYLFSSSFLKRGVFNNRFKPLFNFVEFQKVPNLSSFGTKENLTSSLFLLPAEEPPFPFGKAKAQGEKPTSSAKGGEEKLSGKPVLHQTLNLKNGVITLEKKTESQNFKTVSTRPFNKYKFFQHNKAIYLFQLHLVTSSVLNQETVSLYNEKPLKIELFEKAFKTTSQMVLSNQNKKVQSIQRTKTENKWNGWNRDSSRLKGEILFASSSRPFKMVDFKFFKKSFSEIQFLTHLDLITFALKKSFLLKTEPSTNSLESSKKSAQPIDRKKVNSKIYLGQFVRYGQEISFGVGLNQPGQILILQSKKVVLRYAKPFLLSSGAICDLIEKDFINLNAPLFNLKYKSLKTEDIVQGIPKIEQLFEARGNLFNETGVPYLLEEKFQLYKKEYPRAEAVRKSIEFIQNYIIDGIQNVYQSQGVNISDKHIEIIVKQMTLKVRIVKPNSVPCLEGDLVDLVVIERMNEFRQDSQKAVYEPLVLGITKASLEVESFISAASFQETIKVLTKATIFQRCDFLRGLKENVLLGNLLPTGTGEKWIRHYPLDLPLEKLGKYFLTLESRQRKKLKMSESQMGAS